MHIHFHLNFSRIDKTGVGIKAGGLENFSKFNKRGNKFSVLESIRRALTQPIQHEFVQPFAK